MQAQNFSPEQLCAMVVQYALNPIMQMRVKNIPYDVSIGFSQSIDEFGFKVLWRSISGILLKYRECCRIMPDILVAEISADPEFKSAMDAREESPIYLTVDRALSMIRYYYEHDSEVKGATQYILNVLQLFLESRVAVMVARSEADPTTNIRQFNNSLTKALSGANVGSGGRVELFKPGSPMPSTTYVRRPLGMFVLDKLLGQDIESGITGGMADGEIMLMLGGPGTGKTIFGSSIAWSVAKLKRPAIYLSYENRLEGPSAGDMVARFMCMATGLSKSVFENRDLSTLPKDVVDKIEEARSIVFEHIHLYDFASAEAGDGGINEIRRVLDEVVAKSSIAGSVVIVDWLGMMAIRNMAKENIGSDKKTTYIESWMAGFTHQAREAGFQGIVLHQPNADVVKRNSIPDHCDGSNCRTLGNYVRYAIGLGRVDVHNSIASMKVTKGNTLNRTKNNGSELRVKVDGAYNRFVELDEGMMYDSASGGYVQTAKPSEGGLLGME